MSEDEIKRLLLDSRSGRKDKALEERAFYISTQKDIKVDISQDYVELIASGEKMRPYLIAMDVYSEKVEDGFTFETFFDGWEIALGDIIISGKKIRCENPKMGMAILGLSQSAIDSIMNSYGAIHRL